MSWHIYCCFKIFTNCCNCCTNNRDHWFRKDAIAVNKKILKNKADLDTEKFKSTDKQDQNKISRLKANIASQEQERKGLSCT